MTQVSVVIPAHNEETTIPMLLEALSDAEVTGQLDVVVVCNGCTDETAAVAARWPVRVLEIPAPSKRAAQLAGDAVLNGYPRAYVDADVTITGADLLLCASVLGDGILASAPARRLDLTGSHWIVRAYYAIWRRLPQVDSGLFGRGVVLLSEEGAHRLSRLTDVMSDDLAMSELFDADERVVVGQASAVIRAPRRPIDLVRRRVRVVTGNAQADRMAVRRSESRTSLRTLLRITAKEPKLAPLIPVFVGVTLISRWGARRRIARGDFSTWLRDESSRSR